MDNVSPFDEQVGDRASNFKQYTLTMIEIFGWDDPDDFAADEISVLSESLGRGYAEAGDGFTARVREIYFFSRRQLGHIGLAAFVVSPPHDGVQTLEVFVVDDRQLVTELGNANWRGYLS